MIGIRIGRTERNQERDVCETGRRGRYAIADGPGVLLIVGDLTKAAWRQWPTKRYVFLPARVCHLSRGHEEEARQTIRVERISSIRKQLSRVENTGVPLDNIPVVLSIPEHQPSVSRLNRGGI